MSSMNSVIGDSILPGLEKKEKPEEDTTELEKALKKILNVQKQLPSLTKRNEGSEKAGIRALLLELIE